MKNIKIHHLSLGLIVAFAFLFSLNAGARVYTPSEMPNVQVADRNQYISDPEHLLSPEVTNRVNKEIAQLREQTTVEMVVAIPPDIGDMEPQQWCEKLFTEWKIGKRDKDNGLLVMISPGSRCTFIMPGYGVEGALPDIACNNIINRAIIPAMKEDNLDEAVLASTLLIFNALTDPAVAEELKSAQGNSDDLEILDKEVIINFLCYVAVMFFCIAAFMFFRKLVLQKKLTTNHEKAKFWRRSLNNLFWMGLFGGVIGLIFWLMALLAYRRWRNSPVKCTTCGAKMRRLSEEEDNELLSSQQDFEENLKSVDYDVWECPKCGTIERYPYRSKNTKYTECPACHTVAMCLDSDVVVHPATTRRAGVGVKTYECRYCHHKQEKQYKIPKKQDTAAVVAGAAAASAFSGGGSSGGSGGGFGGGRTGGGGAGGSW